MPGASMRLLASLGSPGGWSQGAGFRVFVLRSSLGLLLCDSRVSGCGGPRVSPMPSSQPLPLRSADFGLTGALRKPNVWVNRRKTLIRNLVLAGLTVLALEGGAKAFINFQPGVQSFAIDCDCSFTGYTGTVGFDFTVNNIQPINRLGVYDANGDGLSEATQVGLWNTTTSTLLASAIVPAGTGSVLYGQFRYVAIPELQLSPGDTYTIGAFYQQPYNSDWYQTITSNNIFSPWFNYLNPTEFFGAFDLPFNIGEPFYGIYGPNLAYEVPGPLPIAGAFAAFSASRKLRRRVRLHKNTTKG